MCLTPSLKTNSRPSAGLKGRFYQPRAKPGVSRESPLPRPLQRPLIRASAGQTCSYCSSWCIGVLVSWCLMVISSLLISVDSRPFVVTVFQQSAVQDCRALSGLLRCIDHQPGAALRSAPGCLVAGLSGRQISADHFNGFPLPFTSHGQSTGGLQAASGTQRSHPTHCLHPSSFAHQAGLESRPES